jgi:hypothetical protein
VTVKLGREIVDRHAAVIESNYGADEGCAAWNRHRLRPWAYSRNLFRARGYLLAADGKYQETSTSLGAGAVLMLKKRCTTLRP